MKKRLAVWTFIVSLVVALATGALQVFRFGHQWRIHEEFAAAAEAEGWDFFQHSGPYRDTGTDGFRRFVERVEDRRRRRGEQFLRDVGGELAVLDATDAAGQVERRGPESLIREQAG